jgi:MFS family permease
LWLFLYDVRGKSEHFPNDHGIFVLLNAA